MQISKLETCKKSQRVNVYVDGEYSFTLSRKLLIEKKLFAGKEIDEKCIEEIRYEDEKEKYLVMVISLVSRRLRSQREIEDYLRRKIGRRSYRKKLIREIIRKLKDYNYIDDEKFTAWWIENRTSFKPRGKYLLKAELIKKGIDSKLIEKGLKTLKKSSEYKMCFELGKKKTNSMGDISNFKNRKKLNDFLLRKGFSFEIVNKVIKKLIDSSN